MLRMLSIALIWVGCAIAWMVLGATVLARTEASDHDLRGDVHELWGPELRQSPPTAVYQEARTVEETETITEGDGTETEKVKRRQVVTPVPIALESSDIGVSLELEHRRKGLKWFPTYSIDFRSSYVFENDTDAPRDVTFSFPLQTGSMAYDDFDVVRQGKSVPFELTQGTAAWTAHLKPGEQLRYDVGYRTRGTTSWHYDTGSGATGQVRNFSLRLSTNFAEVDFPAGTISPSEHGTTGDRWEGAWRFSSLISSAPIGVELPQRLNPGPLASKITFFAPVSLLFFFFFVAVLAAVQARELHPMHYFLIGCSFFAFHLLFAYLVDHVAVLPSFAISSAVAVLLVVSYAQWFVGWKFALREMGLSQLVYLVLFSYTFFWEGFTGLSVTIGAVLTLFVVMQITGRVNWNEQLGRKRDTNSPTAPPPPPLVHPPSADGLAT